MSIPNAVHRVAEASLSKSRPRVNPLALRRPAFLPQRPLAPNTFKRPKGQKEVFLPNVVLTLIRSPHLPANFASFLTPLWFNKLDLKDYLYHLYGIQALSVRSYVIQQKVKYHKPGSPEGRSGRIRWYRPRAQKKMTIEMPAGGRRLDAGQGPFEWPQEPEDMSVWGRATHAQVIEKLQNRLVESESSKWPSDTKSLANKAKEMLQKRAKGESLD